MDDAFEFASIENAAELFRIADIELDKFKGRIAFRTLEIGALYLRRIKVVEIIDDRHMPAAVVKKRIYQMRAYEPGPARYQNIFVHDLLMIR